MIKNFELKKGEEHILTSYDISLEEYTAFNKIVFDLLIADEIIKADEAFELNPVDVETFFINLVKTGKVNEKFIAYFLCYGFLPHVKKVLSVLETIEEPEIGEIVEN